MAGNQAADSIARFTAVSLSETFRKVAGETEVQTAKQLEAFARAWKYKWQRRTGLTNRHQEAATAAHTTVVKWALETVGFTDAPEDKLRNSAEDPWRRYSGGAFMRGIADSSNVLATIDGVNLINKPFMDRVAAQWYRLQFGAGPRGDAREFASNAPHRERGPIQLFGELLGYLDLDLFDASEGFSMPAGFFEGEGRNATFTPFGYLARSAPKSRRSQTIGDAYSSHVNGLSDEEKAAVIHHRIATRGIAKRNYLGEAVYGLATTLSHTWEDIFVEWFTEAKQEARSAVSPVAKAGISRNAAKQLLRGIDILPRGGRPGL